MPPDAWSATSIAGVLRRSLSIHRDGRGSFSEIWRASWTDGLSGSPFVQANVSRSDAGVLRGMHFHRRQSDLWVLVDGRAFVATVDLRQAAEGRPIPSQTFELSQGDAVLIPELVAHGFYALTAITLVYLVSEEYDGSDELGFAWDDRRAAIDWPTRQPVLSTRDANNPTLDAALG